MKTVLCNGCFDILHAGHVRHLKEAAAMGDRLIVSLTADEFVNKGPGRPINGWFDRAIVLEALRFVDEVRVFNNAVDAIRTIKPDLFVKGIDYSGGDKFTEDVKGACESVGAEIRFTSSPKMSATDLIRRTMEIA